MLPKHLRLPSKEIVRIAKNGKRFSGELFDLKVWYDNTLGNPLMTISISVKVDKRSTVRNKIKRKLRAVWAELLKENKITKGKYLIIVKSPKLEETENSEIKKLLSSK
ncbi:MAG: ribonuclease P protein component [Candidatus Dojkabacteria bacterium]